MAEKKNIATGYIGNALRSSAADHTTTFTDEIFDTERQKYQSEVNTYIEERIEAESEALGLAINNETQARSQNDQLLSQAIAAEQERAEAAEQANAQSIETIVAKNEEQEQKLSELDRNVSELDEQINGKESETITTNYALTANDGLNEWKSLSLVAGVYKVYMIDSDNCLITKNPSITIQDVNNVEIASQVMDGENVRSLTLTGDADRMRLYAPSSNVVNSGVVQIVIIVADEQKGIKDDVSDIKEEVGNLQDLTTNAKSNLVSAINEVKSNNSSTTDKITDTQIGKTQQQINYENSSKISELDKTLNGEGVITVVTEYTLKTTESLNEWKPLSLAAGDYKVYMIDKDDCIIQKNSSITVQDANKTEIGSQVLDGENLRSLTLSGDADRMRLYVPMANIAKAGTVQIVIVVSEGSKGLIDDVSDIKESLQTKATKEEVGNLQDLTTDEKGSIVSAINEVAKGEPILPPYYFENDYIVNKVRTIASRCSASEKVLSFAFLTDTHIKNNAKQSAKLIKYINERLNLPFVIFGGDVCITQEGSDDAVLDSAMDFSQYISVLDKSKVFQVRGNHDFNGNNNIYELAEGLTRQFIIGGVNYVGAKVFLSYYYVDVESMNLRIIVLDQYQGTYGGISKEERDWLLNDALNCSGKYLLFVQHQSTDSQVNGYSSAMQAIQEILKGIKNKTNVSGTWGGLTVNHDFSNDTNILVASIVGHCHDDQSHTDNGVLTITTNCDALYKEDSHGYSRVVGTITEQCFDVYSIDLENSKIYATRIGAGVDREFTY